MARPSAYKPEFADQAKRLAAGMGATDIDLAMFFQVSVRTINNWKIDYPAFAKALAVGKKAADKRVEQALYQRAIGYTHEAEEVHIVAGKVVRVPTLKHYPPETTAAIFWLKNRDKEHWRDKHEVEHKGGITVHMDATDSAL